MGQFGAERGSNGPEEVVRGCIWFGPRLRWIGVSAFLAGLYMILEILSRKGRNRGGHRERGGGAGTAARQLGISDCAAGANGG